MTKTTDSEGTNIPLVRDYTGNFIYEDGVLTMILLDNGYYDNLENSYYFYVRDHLGNNRVVMNLSGDVVQSNEYYPFGGIMASSAESGKQPYKYGNKELDTQDGLNLYDFSARLQDPMIPTFTSIDPLAEKYYSWSPYVYVGNNPLNAIDPDGKDGYLVIWMTEEGKIGHAGFAVDNYVEVPLQDNKGNSILAKDGSPIMTMEKDGTVTYYDLWPGTPVGKDNAGEDVKASYTTAITTLEELMTTDITDNEGYAPNGVISIATTYERDIKTKKEIANFTKSLDIYNGRTRNCSDLARVGVESSLGKKIDGREYIPFASSTTPNALFKDTAKASGQYGPNGTKILKYPGKDVNKGFIRALKGF